MTGWDVAAAAAASDVEAITSSSKDGSSCKVSRN
jgi:hypothetical protein